MTDTPLDDVPILNDLNTIRERLAADGHDEVARFYENRIKAAAATRDALAAIGRRIERVTILKNGEYWEDGRDLATELVELGWTPPAALREEDQP